MSEPSLQFERADFQQPRALSCFVCKQVIDGDYYSVNGHDACPACRVRIGDGRRPVAAMNVARAAVYGLGAALVGGMLWGVIQSATGFNIGLVAVGAGLLVGRAVSVGGRRTGGPVFQALAIGATYLAIVAKFISEIVHEASNGSEHVQINSPVQAIWMAIVLFTLPLRGGVENILGYLINGFALYEAWKVNRVVRLQIAGPLRVKSVPVVAEATPEVETVV